jgi:hypothetical protein
MLNGYIWQQMLKNQHWIQPILLRLKPSSRWVYLVLLVCLVPRIILFNLNKESNDDHVEPVLLWQQTGEYPENYDCWECFQPPLFYGMVKVTADVFNVSDRDGVFTIIQLFNAFFSTLLLGLILGLIDGFKLKPLTKYMLMLFWGLNPELISISTLATNDIPLLLLSFLIIGLMMSYWRAQILWKELGLLLLVILAAIIKGNGLVFGIALGAFYILVEWNQRRFKWKNWGRFSVYGVVLIISIGGLGNYYHKKQQYGDPFLTNIFPVETPNWLVPDTIYKGRRGVTSVAETFTTFRILNLLETPYNKNGFEDYPKHRTSFVTQLYGQYSNFLFEQHPNSWQSKDENMLMGARINYIIHLPFFLFMLWQIFMSLKRVLHYRGRHPQTILLLMFILFLAFLLRYSYFYRDFGNMKLIFLFPALYSLVYFFAKGMEYVKLEMGWNVLMGLACLGYLYNFLFLVEALS